MDDDSIKVPTIDDLVKADKGRRSYRITFVSNKTRDEYWNFDERCDDFSHAYSEATRIHQLEFRNPDRTFRARLTKIEEL